MVEFQITEGGIPKLIGGMNLLNAFDICLKENYSQGGVNSERDICSNETETVDPDIQSLLIEYDTTFMKHKWDISLTNLIKHDINTTGSPVVMNPRRQPVHLFKQIEENINEMEKY